MTQPRSRERRTPMSPAPLTSRVPLHYWRAALAEVSLLHPEVPPDCKPIDIGRDDRGWRVTEAAPNVDAWVAAQFAASKAHTDGKPAKTIPFVLIAARLSELASHGAKPEVASIHKGLSVLCIPCLLDRSGSLWPDPDRHPWIPRDLLEPTLKPVALGLLESYDHFISQLPPKAQSFDDTLQAARGLFDAVTGARLPLLPTEQETSDLPPVFAQEGYELVSAWHGLPYDPPIIPRHLIKLYDRIIGDEPSVPLLDALRTLADRPSTLPVPLEKAQRWHTDTVGHINTQHPLSPSQREAMVELARLGAGSVLSVNGPPGTGKTTLLQSVVAQQWVDAALRASDCPIVLVASTNGKAVENVLESFAKICAEIGHQRWHPYDGGFGLFLASESRDTKHPTYTTKSHPFSEHETADRVKSAETHYLERAAALFGRPQASVAAAVKALHSHLQQHAKALRAIVAARYEIYVATGQSVSDGAASSCYALLARHKADIDAAQEQLLRVERQSVAHKRDATTAQEGYQKRWDAIDKAERGWSAHLAASPLWLGLLAFLPPLRRRRIARDRHFLLSNPLTADRRDRDHDIQQHFDALRKAAMDDKANALAAIAKQSAAAERERSACLVHLQAAREAWAVIDRVFRRWQDALQNSHADLLDVSLEQLNDRLDLLIRAPMFSLADWYWSGRWLLEMQQRLVDGERDTKGRVRLEAMYRRFAKLSPCLVSNFHMAPSFFTAWQGEEMPLWGVIDLLIVDEAGQVAPDVGAPMFALARRAIVVGDVHQIEPVWNVGEGTDRVNAAAFGLIATPHDARYDTLAAAGYTCAAGNLMRVANRSCAVQKYADVRGLMLTEHRRCVPELIRYCNELIYAGRLQPMRPALPPAQRLFPAFGRLEILGEDRPVGKSRQNRDEARAIVTWLKANRARIETHYCDEHGDPVPLWKLVGIVTPFTPQASAIERLLRREMPDLMRKDSRLTVGTVHALQGAERSVVIFSPTYGSSYKGGAFFDRTPNMLNVAVSRAKDSFLVIGNLSLFDATRRSRPSGLLAKYLFNEDWGGTLAPIVQASSTAGRRRGTTLPPPRIQPSSMSPQD